MAGMRGRSLQVLGAVFLLAFAPQCSNDDEKNDVGAPSTGGRGAATGGKTNTGGVVTTGGAESGSCASQPVQAASNPVSGTVRGPWIDAVLRENGLRTHFLGPGGSAFSAYSQSFERVVDAGGAVADEFAVRMPSDVVTASLTGWAGTAASEVGAYSELDCGWFSFEMTFPVPDGIVCPSQFANCRPDCEPSGELGLCVPASPKVRYTAVSACEASAHGNWQLELTSVCPHPVSGTLINYQTHGQLTATLINELDASDRVAVNFEF
jgi:hypothetical protein